MKILSAAEMQACDKLTTEKFGVTSTRLMQAASSAVARFAQQQFPEAKRITVLCGRGNNGGDGLHAAHMLAEAGREVTVVLLGDAAGLKGDALEGYRDFLSVKSSSRKVIVITVPGELLEHTEVLNVDLILDAIVGTGFKPPLRDLPLATLNWLIASKCNASILSVDIPSGWDSDATGQFPIAPAFPSDAVITFTAPKPAHVFGQLTHNIRQPIVVAPIGSPDEAILSDLNYHWSGASKSITDHERPADSNKGMYGHVLIVGGSQGKSGAPGMASLSALRIGAGLVTAAVAPSVLPLVAALAPELMTHALAVNEAGEISASNLDAETQKNLLEKITVLAIGPGLGTTPEATDFALNLLKSSKLPAVVDADALNAIAADPGQLAAIAEGRTLVMTPHPGEMSRLINQSTKEVQADRINIARDFAVKHKLILVLKGWRTLIAHPDGRLTINTTGNPGMAKGGSGDLLTGMVAGMLAQHPDDPKRAVEAAVYLHGLAADITVSQPGIGGDQHTLLATDSLAHLYQAFHYRPEAASRYCWIQGLHAESA